METEAEGRENSVNSSRIRRRWLSPSRSSLVHGWMLMKMVLRNTSRQREHHGSSERYSNFSIISLCSKQAINAVTQTFTWTDLGGGKYSVEYKVRTKWNYDRQILLRLPWAQPHTNFVSTKNSLEKDSIQAITRCKFTFSDVKWQFRFWSPSNAILSSRDSRKWEIPMSQLKCTLSVLKETKWFRRDLTHKY